MSNAARDIRRKFRVLKHCEERGEVHPNRRLNGKVERSQRTDALEFHQLLTYTDDADLNQKLQVWENYYNFDRAFRVECPFLFGQIQRKAIRFPKTALP